MIDAVEMTDPPSPLELTDVTVNVYVVPPFRPVFVKNTSDVVSVDETGVVVILYDVAPVDAVHVRSAVSTCGLLGVRFVTASGSVKKLTDTAIPPLPLALTDWMLTTYDVPGDRPTFVSDVPVVVWVGDGGVVVMMYSDAPVAGVHEMSIVVRLKLLGVIPVTAAGRVRIGEDVVTPPVPNEFVEATVNV